MTPAQLASYVRFRTRTNSNTFVDADIVALSRVHMDMLANEILDANVGGEDYFGMPQRRDLVATNGDFSKREYSLPSDLINRFLRAEAYLGGKWVKLTPFDLSGYNHPATEADVLRDFSNESVNAEDIKTGVSQDRRGAYYDIFRNSLWIYSGAVEAYADGLKVWSYTWPAHIIDLASNTDMSIDPSTTTHGFPRALHPILADLIVIDYKQSKEKPIPLTENELNIDKRKRTAIASLRRMSKDEEIVATLPPASEYFNNGYDL